MAKLEPPPDWRWGKALAEPVVDDLLALCDMANQVSLALEEVRLLDQRTSEAFNGFPVDMGAQPGQTRHLGQDLGARFHDYAASCMWAISLVSEIPD